MNRTRAYLESLRAARRQCGTTTPAIFGSAPRSECGTDTLTCVQTVSHFSDSGCGATTLACVQTVPQLPARGCGSAKPAIAFSADERALRDEKCLFVKFVIDRKNADHIGFRAAAERAAADSVTIFPRLAKRGALSAAYSNFRNWTDGRPGRPGLRDPKTREIDFSRRDLLLPQYGHRPERRGDPAFWRATVSKFLNVQKPKLSKIYAETAGVWMRNYPGRAIPTRAMVDYYLRNTYPKRMLDLARRGENFYIQHYRDYLERDPESIRPNECWVADNRQLDFYTKLPDENGDFRAGRCWVCVILDVKSEYVVSIQLSAEPITSVAIRNGLADGIVKFGRPAVFLTDNGKDYTAQGFCKPVVFTPSVDNSEVYEHCIMRELDIECRQSLPYAAQSKVVERFNLEMADWDRQQRGFVGNCPSDRPAAADVWAKKGNVSHLMCIEETAQYLQKFVDSYHAHPAKESKFLRGMTPAQAFAPALRLQRPALDYLEMYFAFLKPLTSSRKVDPRGPAVWCGKLRYVAVEPRRLWPHDGKQVMVKFDNVTSDHCYAFTLAGEFLCECRVPGYVPYLARTDAERALLSDALRRRNRERAELNAMIYAETGGFHKLDPATINLLPREALLENARLRKLDSKHSVGGETHNPAIYVLPHEISEDRPAAAEPAAIEGAARELENTAQAATAPVDPARRRRLAELIRRNGDDAF